MGVVWLILKIIGITILCILGLVLLILALVLFVPIRYRLKGNIKSKEDRFQTNTDPRPLRPKMGLGGLPEAQGRGRRE